MSAKANNFKIGVFTLIAVALLVAGVLAFGAKSYFRPKTTFETAIPGEVSGLNVGSAVQLRGVPVGQVTRIAFEWNIYPASKLGMIIVEFEVEGDLLPLPQGIDMTTAVKNATEKGMRAIVKSQGITGSSMLAVEILDPRDDPPPQIDFTPRYYYIPSAPGQFTRMLESIERSLDNLQKMDFGGIGQGVTNALGAVTSFVRKLDKLDMQGLSTNANLLLVDAKQAAKKLDTTLDDVRGTIKSMKLDGVSQNADKLLTDLQASNTKLQSVLDNAGGLPLQETLVDVRQALQTLNDVLGELKRYPSGFIFGQPPLPAKSVQMPQH